ncbi:hypothetical protein [Mycobacterium phage Fezzik]|nr:hypothetical protein [Mycobacterium phage Fezzik]
MGEDELITDFAEMGPGGAHFGCRVESLSLEGPWRCIGMHCAFCGQPCGAQGHVRCRKQSVNIVVDLEVDHDE